MFQSLALLRRVKKTELQSVQRSKKGCNLEPLP